MNETAQIILSIGLSVSLFVGTVMYFLYKWATDDSNNPTR